MRHRLARHCAETLRPEEPKQPRQMRHRSYRRYHYQTPVPSLRQRVSNFPRHTPADLAISSERTDRSRKPAPLTRQLLARHPMFPFEYDIHSPCPTPLFNPSSELTILKSRFQVYISESELVVRAITKRHFSRLFAATKEHLAGFRRGIFHRRNPRSLVRTITKRLIFRSPTGTPEIVFTLDHFNRIRPFLCDNWNVGHSIFIPCLLSANSHNSRELAQVYKLSLGQTRFVAITGFSKSKKGD